MVPVVLSAALCPLPSIDPVLCLCLLCRPCLLSQICSCFPSMPRIYRCTRLLSCIILALMQPSLAALEPGEIVTDRIGDSHPASDLIEGPPSAKAVRCDALQSRRARRIIQEMLLDDLPASYTLPDSCPFLPSLDMLARFEEGSRNKRRTIFGGVGGQSVWECAHCSKRFQSEDTLNTHLQNFHMAEAGGDGSSLVCLADYCDVLDCFHRSVQVDPITGAVMGEGYGGGAAGTGALYGSAASRARRMRLANEARMAEKEAAGRLSGPLTAAGVPGPAAPASTVAGPSLVRSLQDSATASGLLSAENPLSHRCSHNSMAFAKSRCEAVLLQCFPFGTAGATATPAQAAASASKLSHDLYVRFHAVFCEPLRCGEASDNSGRLAHANAVELIGRRSSESRGRLWTVLGCVLLVALALFYFFVWNLRSEFGWRPTTRVGGGGASTLGAAAAKAQRQQSRLAAWLGMQGKKRTGKIM